MGFKEDLEKGAVGVNGDVKLPLLRKEHGKEYYRRSHKKGKGKSSEAFQGSVATALFCTVVVAMGPLQFGFCVPVYIAEIAPKHLRGGLGAANQLSVTIGIMLAYLFGLFLGWRALAVAGVVPSALLVLGLFFIPESPRWLAKIGNDDFEASLQALRGSQVDVSLEAVEIRSVVETGNQQPRIKFSEIFERKYAMPQKHYLDS